MTVPVMQQLGLPILRTVNYHLVTVPYQVWNQGEAHTVCPEPSGDLAPGLHAQPLVEKVPG